jgi:hypothetical protein
MPDQSGTQPLQFACQGGLVLNQSTFAMQPGFASELINFEPDINGGYRRINGFTRYNTNIVPQTASATEKVLMVASFGSQVIAARGEKIFKAGSTGSWTEIDSGRTNAGKYTHKRFNFNNTNKIVFADGANPASTFDGTNIVDITHASAPNNPAFVEIFQNHLFLAGDSSTPQEVFFSAPFAETNFASADGAGSIKIDDTVVALKVFRDQLYIFGKERIFRLTGTSSATFALEPITRDIGCRSTFSVQEFAGDLLFLAPDGLRTIAGTEKIDDVELGTISKPVQIRFDELTSFDLIESLVIPAKTQYRIFFVNSSDVEVNTTGIIAGIKQEGIEFSELRGIKPSCTDSDTSATIDLIIHGGFDGYVYQQESGNDFNGVEINGKYRSPDLTMGDAGVRKNMHRVILNYAPEAAINADMFLRYDYESPDSPRPNAYPFDSTKVVAIYGLSSYGTATYGGERQPLVRQPVEGSGFAVAIRVNDGGISPPYSLKGFQLEFSVGARR